MDPKKFHEMPLYESPAQKAARGRPVSLPPVEAPSLEGITVTVPAPEAFTEEEVQERFLELARPLARELARAPVDPFVTRFFQAQRLPVEGLS